MACKWNDREKEQQHKKKTKIENQILKMPTIVKITTISKRKVLK